MFKRFLLWLYSGSIIEFPVETCESVYWEDLFGLYVFGDARSIPALQNAVIDALIAKSEQTNTIPTNQYVFLYANTVDNSPLRRLAVDWMVSRIDNMAIWFETKYRCKYCLLSISLQSSDKNLKTLTPSSVTAFYVRDFLFDFIIAQARASSNPASRILDFIKNRANYYVPTSADPKDGATECVKVRSAEKVIFLRI